MKKYFGEAILAAFFIALVAGGALLIRAYKQPLASPMTLNVEAAAPGAAAPANIVPASAVQKPQAQTKKVCGMSGTMTIMVVGRDKQGVWVPPYGADATRFVVVDFNQSEISLFDFHRDLLLDTPSLKKDYNVSQSELGEVYSVVTSKVTNPVDDPNKADLAATNAVAQTIFDNFQIKPDHYATLDEDVLWEVIDDLGGITVNVPATVTIEEKTINAGEQTFDGETAQVYMRFLTATEDAWGRTERQNVVLRGLRAKLTDPTVITKIPDLYQTFKDNVLTDLSLEQINALICMANEVPIDDVAHATIPRTMVTVEEKQGTITINDLNAVKKLVKEALKQ